jgi:PAT family beta-lactamase induction signal transducer AmpG
VLPAAIAGLCIALMSASLDAAVDAHRTDSASGGDEGPAASAFVLGYRVAFVSIGAAVLMLHGKIALIFGPEGDPVAKALAWKWAVASGGAAMLVGVSAALFAPEPPRRNAPESLFEAVIGPAKSFIRSLGPRLPVVLFVALLFRLPDLLGNRMTMPFLRQELGFEVAEIGTIRQALGFSMTIAGAIVGGMCVKRWGLLTALVGFGILQAASNAGYLVLMLQGKSIPVFAAVVVVENLCNGLVSAAFVAYFMTLCEPRFAAAQYAVLSGLMYLAGSLVGATSGGLVEWLGYRGFFLLSIVVGIPPLLALPWAMPASKPQKLEV